MVARGSVFGPVVGVKIPSAAIPPVPVHSASSAAMASLQAVPEDFTHFSTCITPLIPQLTHTNGRTTPTATPTILLLHFRLFREQR